MPCQNRELRLARAPELDFQSCAPELYTRAAARCMGLLLWDIKEQLVCNGFFLPALADIWCFLKKAQLWWAAKMAVICWSILRGTSGSAGSSRPLSLRNGHFWLRLPDRPC